MVQLADSDIKTREVLGWKGVHVLHFAGSSCSQKLRIFLNLKGIVWQSHPVDLHSNENFQPWFLGVNPRGLVPQGNRSRLTDLRCRILGNPKAVEM